MGWDDPERTVPAWRGVGGVGVQPPEAVRPRPTLGAFLGLDGFDVTGRPHAGAVTDQGSTPCSSTHDTHPPTLSPMFDVLVLRPGGGWATDTTGPLTLCRNRVHWLREVSTRGRRQVTHIIDRRTGRKVT